MDILNSMRMLSSTSDPTDCMEYVLVQLVLVHSMTFSIIQDMQLRVRNELERMSKKRFGPSYSSLCRFHACGST
jgi:hypothetical protein